MLVGGRWDLEYPFAKNINAFSARYGQDYFRMLSTCWLPPLTSLTGFNASAVVKRKLMGKLAEAISGLKAGQPDYRVL